MTEFGQCPWHVIMAALRTPDPTGRSVLSVHLQALLLGTQIANMNIEFQFALGGGRCSENR